MAKKSKKVDIVDNTPTLAEQSTQKKIGFFSAMLIAMGSCIGAGIFFKAEGVLKSSQGSFVMAILAWVIAAFAVIAMALALVEIASARNDNLSLIGWCKVFSSRSVYKASKNFMAYIYLPLTYFFMPFYVILSLQDAIGAFSSTGKNSFGLGTDGNADWVIWFLIALAISFFFIIVSGVSSKAGSLMNNGIMAIKFIPLIGVVVLGIVMFAMNPETVHVSAGPTNEAGITSPDANQVLTEFGYMTPGIGLFMAVGAIFFAYDGFYVTAGLSSEMKEPKKTPVAIVMGLGLTTIIYLAIAIVMSISGNGGLFGFQGWLADHNASWVFGVLNLTIAIGVLGIINGFAMWAPRFVEDLIKDDELPFSQKYKDRLNPNKPIIGIWYSIVITVPVVVVFTLIGALAYINTYGDGYGSKEMGSLYTFCDLTGTWTAVFAFLFIMLPIAGGLKNRKTMRVKTEQSKYFVPMAWISVIVISLVMVFTFVDPFVNVFMLINLGNKATYDNGYYEILGGTDGIVGRVMKLATLFIFVALMVIPTFIEDKIHVKKYGSIANYEKALGLEATHG